MTQHRDTVVEPLASLPPPLGPQVAKSCREEHSAEAGGFAPEAGKRMRISSLTPVIVSSGALLMGSILTLATMLNAITRPALTALLLVLAAILTLIGLALKSTLKSVTFDGQHYRITGFLLSEEVGPSDVCLVVEARGVLWNSIRLHFNRPTRFGYAIAFVPAVSRKDFAACLRGFRNPAVRRSPQWNHDESPDLPSETNNQPN